MVMEKSLFWSPQERLEMSPVSLKISSALTRTAVGHSEALLTCTPPSHPPPDVTGGY